MGSPVHTTSNNNMVIENCMFSGERSGDLKRAKDMHSKQEKKIYVK